MDEATAGSSIALVGVLFFLMIIELSIILQLLLHLSNFRYALQSFMSLFLKSRLQYSCRDNKTNVIKQQSCISKTLCVVNNTKDLCVKKLCIEELATVVENLGRLSDDNRAKKMAELLEEDPSLEEVKQTFNLFDENGDGFIDAGEIKKVLHVLGYVQASDSECKRMIKCFDQNGDGCIDLEEFVKLMEDSFC